VPVPDSADTATPASDREGAQVSVATSAPEASEDWWVQLEDLGDVHCEPTQGVTFDQVVSAARKTYNARNLFFFLDKRIVIIPQAGQPIMQNFDSAFAGMVHTTHRVNMLLVDGPPYSRRPAFRRIYIYSKTPADCHIALAYAHFLLGF
jgi:hypothetical protein